MQSARSLQQPESDGKVHSVFCDGCQNWSWSQTSLNSSDLMDVDNRRKMKLGRVIGAELHEPESSSCFSCPRFFGKDVDNHGCEAMK